MNRFSGLIGHEKIKEVFSRMLSNNLLPHAILFIGPEHIGKTTFIESLVKTLFETEKSFALIPDVVTIERESDPKTEKFKTNLSVEQVREFTHRLSMSPILGSWKVGFIEEARRLSNAAANALLKTLEEPKGKTLILLRATTVKDLPATIVSRCQVIRMYPVATAEIVQAFVKKGLTKTDAITFAKRSYGRPGLAIASIASSKIQVEADVHVSTFLELLESSMAKQFGAVTNLVSKDEQNKTDELLQLLNEWEPVLRDVLLIQNNCAELCVQENERKRIERLAKRLSPSTIRMLFDRMQKIRIATRSNINVHLSLEHLFLATSL